MDTPSMDACIHAYKHTCTHAYIHIHLPTYLHAYIRTYIHASLRPCIHTYIHFFIHSFIHAFIHSCIYIHTTAYACMHTLEDRLTLICGCSLRICAQAYVYEYVHVHACYQASYPESQRQKSNMRGRSWLIPGLACSGGATSGQAFWQMCL